MVRRACREANEPLASECRERLIKRIERMNMEKSDTISAIASALVIAQAKIEGATKDKENEFFDSKYADLASVMKACKEHLNEQGISVVQTPLPAEGQRLALQTVLIHKSGEWIGGTISMPLQKNDPQGYGSALTYARRYGLAAMVGVCPEDDDANDATPRADDRRQPARAPAQRQNQKPASKGDPNGDVKIDDNFRAAIFAELHARSFNAKQSKAAIDQFISDNNLKKPSDAKVYQRTAFIAAIKAGKFDQHLDANQSKAA
jgi:hypothetical protein